MLESTAHVPAGDVIAKLATATAASTVLST